MSKSSNLFEEAKTVMPGGVNSPVRSFNGVGGQPVFFNKAAGAYLYDVDDNKLIDYVGSWGPMILGHNHPEVVSAVREQALAGMTFGAPTELETCLAKLIRDAIPSMELIRMVNSGTEATMSAIRLARGFTGRERIIKFEGCYHGHSDSLLVKAGSGALTLGIPSSPGVPKVLAEQTTTLKYNDLKEVQQAFQSVGSQIACVIIEPVAGNMNCIPPAPGFLEGIRELCDKHGTLLIFDEVMTGFRVALGGAQGLYQVKPDLTTLGKIIGGGLPVGAFGGLKVIMEHLAPLGPIYQAGTLSGNPLAMAAGISTLKNIRTEGFYESIATHADMLLEGLQKRANQADIPFTTSRVGGMFGMFFTDRDAITTFEQVTTCNTRQYAQFFHAMLNNGVYLAPSPFEASFISIAHQEREIVATLNAAEKSFATLSQLRLKSKVTGGCRKVPS